MLSTVGVWVASKKDSYMNNYVDNIYFYVSRSHEDTWDVSKTMGLLNKGNLFIVDVYSNQILCFQGFRSFGSRSGRRPVGSCCRVRHRHRGWRRSPGNGSTASPLRRHDPHPHFRRGPRSLRSDCRHLSVHKINRRKIIISFLLLFFRFIWIIIHHCHHRCLNYFFESRTIDN